MTLNVARLEKIKWKIKNMTDDEVREFSSNLYYSSLVEKKELIKICDKRLARHQHLVENGEFKQGEDSDD